MKQWLLVFAGGLVAGVALGLLVASRDRGTGGGSAEGAGGESRLRIGSSSGASSKAAGRDATRQRKAGERDERWQAGQPRVELVDYLETLGKIDGLGEINFMELIRHGHQITMLNEDEARAMLALMVEAHGEEKDGDSDEFRGIAFALVFARWAELNGPEAMRYVVEEKGGLLEGDEDDLAAVGLTSWVEADPAGAAAWFRTRTAAGDDERLMNILRDDDVQQSFFAAMARSDREEARKLAVEAGDIIQDDAMAALARSEPSPEGLRELLESTRPDDWRSRRGVLAEWSKRDPAGAAAWLETQPAGDEHERLVFGVALEFVSQDPEAGAAWFMQQEIPANTEAERYKTVVSTWVERDVDAASRWLDQQADVPGRDGAEARIAYHLADHGRFEDAFRWASEVQDEKLRAGAVQQIFGEGWNRDTQAMRGEVVEAAEAAGFGEQVEGWAPPKKR